MEALEQVVSADGTSIAIWRSGSGPPLVLVHGTAADHGRWAPVLPALEARFTVLAIDRRGRGGSGDADDYALQREYEDVVAAVEAAVAETKRVARRKMKRAVKRSFERGYDSGNEAGYSAGNSLATPPAAPTAGSRASTRHPTSWSAPTTATSICPPAGGGRTHGGARAGWEVGAVTSDPPACWCGLDQLTAASCSPLRWHRAAG